MLSNLVGAWFRRMAGHVGKVIAKSGLTPNALTFLGLLLNFPAAIVLAQGKSWSWWLGGLLVLFAGVFDMLDGAVARVTNRTTTFGAFFDSTLDRYGELIIYGGLLVYYTSVSVQPVAALLIFIAAGGSTMVSYTRARAEGLNIQCKEVGLLQRPERVGLIAIGAIANTWLDWAMIAVLWLLAVGTNFTAIQRISHIWLEERRGLLARPSTPAPKPQPVAPAPKTKETPAIEPAETPDEEEMVRRGWRFRRAGR